MHPSAIPRRDFLRYAAAGGAATVFNPARAVAEPRAQAGEPAFDVPAFELEELTIADLQRGMASGRWTAVQITEAYLSRIETLDRSGPQLNQVLQTNPRALEIATRLDRERRDGQVRGPMHGIPVLIKDNIDTADDMLTTAGSLALMGSRPSRDAFIVDRLRAAGAIILGKTNLSEWANFRSTQSSSGWSGRGGQGKNPYALDRSPCGSSAGSGAATSANFAAIGIGTETDGSIVCPSATNGVVGIKPTIGLVSRSGIIPIAHSQDTAGPMARTVRDAALLLDVLAGEDPRDAGTRGMQGRIETDYTRFLDPDGLRGARIGVLRQGFAGYSPEADGVLADAIMAMTDAGAVVIDPTAFPTAGQYGNDEFEVLLYEFKADLNAYLTSRGPAEPSKTLADLIAFNERHADQELRYFGQEIFLSAEEKGPLTDQAYREALERSKRLAGPEGIDAAMDEQQLDALVAVTGSPAWTVDLVNGDHFLGASSGPAAVSGYANITVPAGYRFGLPVGISFIGRAFAEPTLLKLASGFERVTQVRRAPTFRAHAAWT
ncbi:MAG TPA: amidase [Gemmatimonadales bacterium]